MFVWLLSGLMFRGPLLGIFLTGPGGFVLGGLAGALWWRLVKPGANRNGSKL